MASPHDTKIHVKKKKTKTSNFRLLDDLMVEVCLGFLNEHVQHQFAICQQISLYSGFRKNDCLSARNPYIAELDTGDLFLLLK